MHTNKTQSSLFAKVSNFFEVSDYCGGCFPVNVVDACLHSTALIGRDTLLPVGMAGVQIHNIWPSNENSPFLHVYNKFIYADDHNEYWQMVVTTSSSDLLLSVELIQLAAPRHPIMHMVPEWVSIPTPVHSASSKKFILSILPTQSKLYEQVFREVSMISLSSGEKKNIIKDISDVIDQSIDQKYDSIRILFGSLLGQDQKSSDKDMTGHISDSLSSLQSILMLLGNMVDKLQIEFLLIVDDEDPVTQQSLISFLRCFSREVGRNPLCLTVSVPGKSKHLPGTEQFMKNIFLDSLPSDEDHIKVCTDDGKISLMATRLQSKSFKELGKEDGSDALVTKQREGSVLITGGVGGIGLRLAVALTCTELFISSFYVEEAVLITRLRTSLSMKEVALKAAYYLESFLDSSTERKSISQLLVQLQNSDDHHKRHIVFVDESEKKFGLQRSDGTVAVFVVKAADLSADGASVSLSNAIGSLNHNPIKLAIHAAGVKDDKLIAQLTDSDFFPVISPKVNGALALTSVLEKDVPIVLCSSISVVLSTPGQSVYCAANAAMEGISASFLRAEDRRRVIAVEFGPWAHTGMAADSSLHFVDTPSMNPVDCLHSFSSLLSSDDIWRHSVVTFAAPFSSHVWSQTSSSPPSSLFHSNTTKPSHPMLASPTPSFAPPSSPASLPLTPHSVSSPSTSSEKDIACKLINIALTDILGNELPSIEATDTTPLSTFGLDSLASTELRRRLSAHCKLSLPLASAQNPNMSSLVSAMLRIGLSSTTSPPPNSIPQLQSPVPIMQQSSQVSQTSLSPWLIEIVGDLSNSHTILFVFNDAGGDATLFKVWKSVWSKHSQVMVSSVQLPGRHSRRNEPQPFNVSTAADEFWEEMKRGNSIQILMGRKVTFFGQCIGGFFALHFAASYSRQFPSAPAPCLITSACPSPDALHILTKFTSNNLNSESNLSPEEKLRQGLKELTLAIGFTIEDWNRLEQNPVMYQAVVADVKMTDAEGPMCFPKGLNLSLCVALLGQADPVVKPKHLAGWLECGARTTSIITFPSLGHNIQYEDAVIQQIEKILT
eukprot:TRINITY_DN7819_c0_g1_i1.p1 TRINITY_DN7819_c0_g1~~TRINITY_DN7819_c0_g1_i1.p1  ORF type:complete len:1170 (-),score=331.34 TRINITY_DN7819_c0_g1_i1:215-3394(-)